MLNLFTHFIFEKESSKGPNGSKNKVEFIYFLGSVRRSVFWGQQGLQQVAQSLYHAHLQKVEKNMTASNIYDTPNVYVVLGKGKGKK